MQKLACEQALLYIWTSEASLARTRERAAKPRGVGYAKIYSRTGRYLKCGSIPTPDLILPGLSQVMESKAQASVGSKGLAGLCNRSPNRSVLLGKKKTLLEEDPSE